LLKTTLFCYITSLTHIDQYNVMVLRLKGRKGTTGSLSKL